ncbi:type IVB secretion system protein IcmG/DotF [Legionella longbeachae]|uniref:Component of the Dot/Icm secretion system n=1 Tax=Legionella longbeachae serogroup 1 (strain NSW150) TaxID=661367 RepID=D3HL98_LEGLN|nr:type IVB secretion system protein IcmG/DotF [Legionella longbeachae]VEE03723.1 Component of the Dot/Icm secretion system [Legionella oakridgensis]HBD7397473.1 type IVB secretion system protein IcmG/DotF [Legionella pneumophila]ARB93397.1 type IV secretion protein IcmG [Legionella longbeachae]ARM33497.1 type IV secretion protein IcmG [Legionella longbeachae]EEZ93648.1 IcmG [Legionella longbeachae D-4968]
MADNDQNDEYKFAELDSLENDSIENPEYSPKSTTSMGQGGAEPRKNIKRNALIAVGFVVFIMLMYKFVGGMFFGKSTKVPTEESITPAPVAEITPSPQPQQPPQTEIPQEPIQQPQVQAIQPRIVEESRELKQKVASIEATQQTVQTEVSSVNQQVGNVNNNVNALSAQIAKLNQVISDLSNQVAKQSEEINVLMERTKPKLIKRIIHVQPPAPQINYYINAVIPGRAWLIGTNGSTLTVREGSKIEGYGVVKLIDSLQGRVLTSSGRVIRFSQDDS